MRFGLFGVNFGPCADPALAIRVAVAAEEAGFESAWTGEHVAMPIRDNPVPTPPETPLLDSLVALANVAAHTRRLRLGTGILVLPPAVGGGRPPRPGPPRGARFGGGGVGFGPRVGGARGARARAPRAACAPGPPAARDLAHHLRAADAGTRRAGGPSGHRSPDPH